MAACGILSATGSPGTNSSKRPLLLTVASAPSWLILLDLLRRPGQDRLEFPTWQCRGHPPPSMSPGAARGLVPIAHLTHAASSMDGVNEIAMDSQNEPAENRAGTGGAVQSERRWVQSQSYQYSIATPHANLFLQRPTSGRLVPVCNADDHPEHLLFGSAAERRCAPQYLGYLVRRPLLAARRALRFEISRASRRFSTTRAPLQTPSTGQSASDEPNIQPKRSVSFLVGRGDESTSLRRNNLVFTNSPSSTSVSSRAQRDGHPLSLINVLPAAPRPTPLVGVPMESSPGTEISLTSKWTTWADASQPQTLRSSMTQPWGQYSSIGRVPETSFAGNRLQNIPFLCPIHPNFIAHPLVASQSLG